MSLLSFISCKPGMKIHEECVRTQTQVGESQATNFDTGKLCCPTKFCPNRNSQRKGIWLIKVNHFNNLSLIGQHKVSWVLDCSPYINPTIIYYLAVKSSVVLRYLLSLCPTLSHLHRNMRGFSFRSLTFILFIVFLVWSASFDTCIARRGKHWRQSISNSASLAKKKGKSHGNSHHHHHSGVSKPKTPSHKAPAPPPPVPKEKPPKPSPPQKGSTTFNVLDFGAKGNGKSDDTKVLSCLLHNIKLLQNRFQFIFIHTYIHTYIHI